MSKMSIEDLYNIFVAHANDKRLKTYNVIAFTDFMGVADFTSLVKEEDNSDPDYKCFKKSFEVLLEKFNEFYLEKQNKLVD
jgi:hypothetical protein